MPLSSARDDKSERVLRRLARKASGMTGADIERLLRLARQRARRKRRSLTWSDIETLLASAKPERSAGIRIRLAFHEAAHAVARVRLGLGEITMITIEDVQGGFVSTGPCRDYDETEELLTGMLVIILAGRAAEEEAFGTVTTGAGGSEDSDLATATELAFDMETRLGFGQDAPLLYTATEDRSLILLANRELAARVNARLENAYAAARKLVVARMDAIQLLSGALMVHGTLEGDRLGALLARVREMVADPPNQA